MTKADAPAMRGPGTEALFDTGRYCLHDRKSTAYRDLVAHAREELRDDNCVVLPDFVRTAVLHTMQAEGAAKAGTATYTEKWLNPYFSEPPDDVPENHPLKRLALRCHGMVRADRFAHDGTIRALFKNEDLCRFVADPDHIATPEYAERLWGEVHPLHQTTS